MNIFRSLSGCLLNDLLLDLNLKILNIVNILDQFLEAVLFSFEKLFYFFLVFLHPFNKLTLSFRLLLKLLFLDQLTISIFLSSKIIFINTFSNLSCCLLRSYGYFSSVYLLYSRKIFSRSKITVSTESRYFLTLRIIHFCIFNSPIVVSSQLFYSYFPMVKLSQQPIDIIIEGSNLVLRTSPILNLLYFFNDIISHLLPPSLTFV
jgi:hypothetical protein